jgi:methionyl-tRNA formyltransferase
MRILFAGTPAFAETALAAIIDAGYDVALVLTQPDRPAGRGMKMTPSPVKQLALARGLTVATPPTLSLHKGGEAVAAVHAQMGSAKAEVLVVAAYGLILPQAVLDIPAGLPDAGCGRITALNIHASLLPRWRGAAPVARAIEAGDTTTGITIMQVDAGLDSGPMLLAEATPIAPSENTATLTARLASIGARLIVTALREAAADRLRAVPQPTEGVTYARKLVRPEAWIDFTLDAFALERKVRAFDPFPGACAALDGVTLKFWRAHAASTPAGVAPGTIVDASATGLHISCGKGMLIVTELQRPGSKRLPVQEFLSGNPIPAGAVLSAPPLAAAAGP